MKYQPPVKQPTVHPHWNSTPKAPPTTDERIAALEEALKMANDCAQQRFAAMQATIDELRAKVQAREPIGSPWIGTPIGQPLAGWPANQGLEAAKQRLEQAKQASQDWIKWAEDPRKEAQPDLFPSHKPLARGYVDPNRPDQGKAVVLPSGVKITGVSGAAGSVSELINQFWANAQATQAQADRDGENLKK